jgi:hypothetical protein
LRSFLGLAGYYKKFVQHFSIIAKPLSDLLKKNSIFTWTDDQEIAFKLSSQVTTLVLFLPNFSKTFYIETDAYDLGVGALLM